MLTFHLLHTVKTTKDDHMTKSAIGAVAGPRAHTGAASVVSQLHLPSKDEGLPNHVYFLMLLSW